ncbi:MAG: DEAD/DEAH box helicase family protein [Oscillospiraceae bacterium]|nr:DEAD/DEAH box helicase family protein [Oscillospiraceae bacterium]
MGTQYRSASGSPAEDLFIEIFADTFGAHKAGFLYTQYYFPDIYLNDRYADFMIERGMQKIAIEIDDEATHNPKFISRDKFQDDLLKQNSMIHLGWDIYRWTVCQMRDDPERVKDELRLFLGSDPAFSQIDDYLPKQRARAFEAKSLELKEHQKEALDSLMKMRETNETIALLYHATGTGKTVTAVSDAKRFGKRTLFIAHTHELVEQAYETFKNLWPGVSIGKYIDTVKEPDSFVVCAGIQSIAVNLDRFREYDFGYIIIDEAHHANADTYQKVISFFKPEFTLGLTATPERCDDRSIIDIFKNTAHKLDIKTAVEIGELVPVRCIRIHTNIDLSNVRFNSVRYNIRDLESKIFVPERNTLIADTFIKYVKDKRTVIFCASVKHAEEIAQLITDRGVKAYAVSGSMKASLRSEYLAAFKKGTLKVICACDLLNEGWDCPETEVLFMARPTMSKVLYIQQLGRGMRLAPEKESLIVFDFVDNANKFNAPFSLHRYLQLKNYRPGGMVLGKKPDIAYDESLYAKGEKPEAIIDYPVNVTDFQAVDIFNWQDEAAGMISMMEFVRRVDVQSETIERYVREGLIIPDLIVPMSEHKVFRYFKEETVNAAAHKYGWRIITDSNRAELFMEMIRKMDMSYSYKLVLIKAVFENADEKGRVKLDDIAAYFRKFYEERRAAGLKVEKANSIFAKGGYTDAEAMRNILANPFKRFEDMQMMRHAKTIGIIEVDQTVWKRIDEGMKEEILRVCEEKIEGYYGRR